MRRRITLALTTALLCFGAAAVVPQMASASATGFQQWGGFTIDAGGIPVGIPNGTLVHSIDGDGTLVRSHTADFSAWGNVCNWRMDFVYRDVRGVKYLTSQGGMMNFCNRPRTADLPTQSRGAARHRVRRAVHQRPVRRAPVPQHLLSTTRGNEVTDNGGGAYLCAPPSWHQSASGDPSARSDVRPAEVALAHEAADEHEPAGARRAGRAARRR